MRKASMFAMPVCGGPRKIIWHIMEPLCTVPEYRRKGLAAAALAELYRRMKPLGATHMTGGDNPFYKAIGYQSCISWTIWEKKNVL